jgi:hypothetical protein
MFCMVILMWFFKSSAEKDSDKLKEAIEHVAYTLRMHYARSGYNVASKLDKKIITKAKSTLGNLTIYANSAKPSEFFRYQMLYGSFVDIMKYVTTGEIKGVQTHSQQYENSEQSRQNIQAPQRKIQLRPRETGNIEDKV